MEQYRGTTILSVARDPKSLLAATGQVTSATSSSSHRAQGAPAGTRKRYWPASPAAPRCLHPVRALRGQARQALGHLLRSAVELAKDWRTDRMLRRLEAMLAVADREYSLIITGNGDV